MLHLKFKCPECGFKDNEYPIEGDGRVNIIDSYLEGSVICPSCDNEFEKHPFITNDGYLAVELIKVTS